MRLGVAPTPVSTIRADKPRPAELIAVTIASGVSVVGVTVVTLGLETPVVIVSDSAPLHSPMHYHQQSLRKRVLPRRQAGLRTARIAQAQPRTDSDR